MASTPPTDQEILDAIKQAILDNVTRGATSITIGGRTLQGLGLDRLEEMRRYYERRVSLAANGSRARVGKFRAMGSQR